MNVKELIKELKKEDPNRVVVCSRDWEGNDYSLLSHYMEKSFYEDGKTGLEKLTDENREKGYTEDDVLENGVPALILFPNN
jgi:hypothetical protein